MPQLFARHGRTPTSTPSDLALSPSAQLQLDLFAAFHTLVAPDAPSTPAPQRLVSSLPVQAAAPAPPPLAWPPGSLTSLDVLTAERTGGHGALTACVFDAYAPHVTVPGASPHPTALVESAAMAAAAPPPCTYRPLLPQRLVANGLLSDAQLQTVCYAGQAHAGHLPEGQRQGFFLGDGTGVSSGGAERKNEVVALERFDASTIGARAFVS